MTSILDITSPTVADHLARNPVAVIPFGSVEQHGPHLPNGTDTMAAQVIADQVAARLEALVVPFGPYGVTPIHAGHPGTISLGRATFEALLTDIGTELVRMGATVLVFVNWHEGNNASLDAVATDLQSRHSITVITSHACYVAQRLSSTRLRVASSPTAEASKRSPSWPTIQPSSPATSRPPQTAAAMLPRWTPCAATGRPTATSPM